MKLEGRFVRPARMDVEEQRVSGRPEGVNAQAALLPARGREGVEDGLRHGALAAGPRVKSRKDRHLHVGSPGRESSKDKRVIAGPDLASFVGPPSQGSAP